MKNLKLHKAEKLCSVTAIDALFSPASGNDSALAYPIRMVWRSRNPQDRAHAASVQFFISVPKRRLRHAVDRVTMRRRIREAYRLSRHLIPEGVCADVGFIYVAADLRPYDRVLAAMQKLLPQL